MSYGLGRASVSARVALALLLAGALGLLLALARTTPQVGSALLLFVLAVVLTLYLPGRALLGLLGLAPGLPLLEHVALCLTLGIPASSLAYALCGRFGVRWLFGVFVALAALACVPGLLRRAGAGTARVREGHLWLAAVLLCACAPFAFSPFHFRNLAPLPDGGLTHFAEVDPIFHVALARELQHQIPPQIPFMPGRPLSYHYGSDLLAAMLSSAGLDAAPVTLRFLPLLLMGYAVLACFCCARAWLSCERAAALFAFLVILAEDFSFVPGLLLGTPQGWAAHFFQMPSSLALYMLNPMLPAIGLLMCALLCLERHFAGGRRGWLLAAALAAAALCEYKVFVAAHLLGALGLTALVYLVRFRRWAPVLACAAMGLACALPLLGAVGSNAGLHKLTLGPWPYVSQAFARMGLVAPWGFVALPVYLLLAIGARAAGLGALLRGLLHQEPSGAARFLAAVFAASGAPLTLLFVISVGGYAPGRGGLASYNNSVWFFVGSKAVLWLFALGAVWDWAAGRRGRQLAGALLLVALSVPSSLQTFARFRAVRLDVVEAPTLEVLEFLKREAPAGSVCLARERLAPLLLLTTPCRTLEFDLYNTSFVSRQEERGLRRAYRRFWRAWDQKSRDLGPALSALDVDYLIVGRRSAPPGAELRAGPSLSLRRRLESARFVVYRVERTARPDQASGSITTAVP